MNAVTPPTIDTELARIQGRIAATRKQLEGVQQRHDRHVRDSVELVGQCNRLADQLQPLYKQEATLFRAKQIACYTGLASGGLLGLGPGLMSFSPAVGLAVTLVDIAVLGASFLVVEGSKRRLDRLRPQIDSMTWQWKGLKSRADAADAETARTRAEIRPLQASLDADRSQEQVMLMARGVNNPPKPDESVRTEDDAIVIGRLRIPRRSPAAEKAAQK